MKLNNLFPQIWNIFHRETTEQIQEVKVNKIAKIINKFLASPHGTILVLKINRKKKIIGGYLKYVKNYKLFPPDRE